MYLIAYVIVILGISALSFMGMTQLNFYFLNDFIDVPSIMILLLILVPTLILTNYLKDLNNALRFSTAKKLENISLIKLKRALEAVNLTIHTLIYSSIFIAMGFAIVTLHNLSDIAALGPNVSVVLITILYAAFISLILQPVKTKLNTLIMNYLHDE